MVTQEDLKENPFAQTNPISKLFFWWLNSFFTKGSSCSLDASDLYKTLPNDNAKLLGEGLSTKWSEELQKRRLSKKTSHLYKPSLLKALIREFGWRYMGMGMLLFVEECVTRIAQPIFLGYLIRYFTDPKTYHSYEGYLYAAGVVFSAALCTMVHHPFFCGVRHVGMKVRVACCSLVYRKSLRLSQAALGKTNVGQLVNLISNDVNRFDQCTMFLHYVWVGPVEAIIVTYIVWGYFGPSCLAGLSVLVFFVPCQGYFSRWFSRLRTATAGRTDIRIRVLNEIIAGIRVIKMYAWEKPFSMLVNSAREDEVKVVRKVSRLRALNMSLFYVSSKMLIFLTLLVYVIVTGNSLTAEKVFVSLSLFANMRLALTLWFTYGVAHLAEMLVSIKRLQDYLLMEERRPRRSPSAPTKIIPNITLVVSDHDKDDESVQIYPAPVGVYMENFSAKWSSEHTENTLTNISLQVKPRELLAIIGQVGCGKGSLLQAILKELPPIQGKVSANGSIAYTSQEPWVFAGNVRQNIIFGKEFDATWYESVIQACALQRDIELFPFGDQTLVGERGASLSGGQKARITLARAVYANADIYLLDDPLSAVDAEVGKHLFEECVCGILAEKAVILVTHQLQFLKSVENVILLNSGCIQAQGSYDELLASGIDFTQLLEAKESQEETPTSSARKTSMLDYRPRSQSQSSVLSYNTVISESEEYVEEIQLENVSKVRPKPVAETVQSGGVKLSLYWKYYRAGAGYLSFIVLILFNTINQVCFTGADWWLNFWTKTQRENYTLPVTSEDVLYPIYTNRNVQIYVYSGIMVCLFIASTVRTLLFFNICMNSSIILHDKMFTGIIRAPMQFFEENPIGRMLNRMAKDIGVIDEQLPATSFDVLEIFGNVFGILVIVAVVNPILLLPSVMMVVMFYFLRRYYLKTARSVKRLEGVARSPVYSHLSTTLYGLTTIRAYRAEEELCRQFDEHLDMHSSSWFLFITTTSWLGLWVDWMSVVYLALVTFSFMHFATDGAQVGLAVSSAMMLTGMFQFGVHQSAEVENQMVSVERVLEYTEIEPEAPLESIDEEKKPHPSWPFSGEITMKSVQLCYGKAKKPVLKDISCIFKSKEKVGIVGRTGAGKSTLITALFRLCEPTFGEIEIDGVNTLEIGLHELRSKISIIPQEPVLFMGSLRKNLDPFGEYSDDEIWSVLQDVHLAEEIKQTAAGLLVEVSEGGSNFSVGQRQLVCLGRAILRKNKILILDEATANVDPETDALIQKTIRTKFMECTVLTVAHRLHTVMDCDKILVLDAGSIKEYNEPYVLLQNHNGALYSLVQQTGISTAESLYQIAKDAYLNRKRNQEDGQQD